MNSPRHHEMDKLQAIDQQRAAIAQRLDERLPRQYTQLLALVATTKWRLTTLHQQRASVYTQDLMETTVKKLRMEVGAFEYAAKEQSELLTRALFQLDDILSHGDATIKDTRKALVLSIQQLLERADAMKVKATSLKEFTDRTIDRLPVVADEPMEEPADVNEAAVEVEAETESTSMEQEDDDWEQVHADDMRPLFASEDEEDAVTQEEPEEEPTPMDDAAMVQPKATENETPQDVDDQEEDDAEEEEEEATATDEVEEEESNGSLPLWRPYYQIQKRPDGVYIVANLRGVDPRAIQVHAMPQQGVVRIAGVKYPTQKDLLLSRLSGAPTFGRFEIVERFPAHMLNLENASQQLSQDGTLQVRLPYYFVEHPRVMRRISPFQPHGLMVW